MNALHYGVSLILALLLVGSGNALPAWPGTALMVCAALIAALAFDRLQWLVILALVLAIVHFFEPVNIWLVGVSLIMGASLQFAFKHWVGENSLVQALLLSLSVAVVAVGFIRFSTQSWHVALPLVATIGAAFVMSGLHTLRKST